MIARRFNPYRTFLFLLGMALTTAFWSGSVIADPNPVTPAAGQANSTAPAAGKSPLVLADASDRAQSHGWTAPSIFGAGQMLHPPSQPDDDGIVPGLSTAAIIRPIKDKEFALVFAMGTPGQFTAPRADASVFNPSLNPGNEILQWVMMADMLPIGPDSGYQNAMPLDPQGAAGDQGPWRYSMEMIFVPMASLLVHAGFSMAPDLSVVDSHEIKRALEHSQIGISIGLDFRPKDGVMLDVDYARVMIDTEAAQDSLLAPNDAEDRVRVSLTIQF